MIIYLTLGYSNLQLDYNVYVHIWPVNTHGPKPHMPDLSADCKA